MSTNFAKTLVWKQDYNVILWRYKQRTPNTNDYPMPLNETPHEKFLRTPLDVSVESFTQAVYLNCNFAKWLLKYAITYYAFVLKNRHSGKVKSDNVDKAKIQNSYEKKESVSPTNTQSNVWVNDRIESYLVRISKTVKDLNLCIIGKFMLFDTKVIIFM